MAKKITVTLSDKSEKFFNEVMYSFEGDKVIMLPEGNWKLLGLADQLTEMELREIMDHCHFAYTDFMMPEPQAFNGGNICLKSAKDSFDSLLKANGIVTVNTKPHPAEIFGSGNNYHPENRVMYDRIIEEWQQAEQELWTNPVILLKQ